MKKFIIILVSCLIGDFCWHHFAVFQYFCEPVTLHELGYQIQFPETMESAIKKYHIKPDVVSDSVAESDTTIKARLFEYLDDERYILDNFPIY